VSTLADYDAVTVTVTVDVVVVVVAVAVVAVAIVVAVSFGCYVSHFNVMIINTYCYCLWRNFF
jgi:hypothetical protein